MNKKKINILVITTGIFLFFMFAVITPVSAYCLQDTLTPTITPTKTLPYCENTSTPYVDELIPLVTFEPVNIPTNQTEIALTPSTTPTLTPTPYRTNTPTSQWYGVSALQSGYQVYTQYGVTTGVDGWVEKSWMSTDVCGAPSSIMAVKTHHYRNFAYEYRWYFGNTFYQNFLTDPFFDGNYLFENGSSSINAAMASIYSGWSPYTIHWKQAEPKGEDKFTLGLRTGNEPNQIAYFDDVQFACKNYNYEETIPIPPTVTNTPTSTPYCQVYDDGYGDSEPVASFGMNYQQCNQMVFMSYDFKFEAFYQAVRRCYRFGQVNKVTVHILIPESQLNVRQTILEKEKQHFERIGEMAKYSAETNYKTAKSKVNIVNKEVKTPEYHLINGDCVMETAKLPDNCADIVVFSPPFAELYVYSDKEADMGNVQNYKQFENHFQYLIPELKRTLKPGRICAIHCMDLPIQKGKEGYIGLRDFSGMLIRWFQKQGFIYHSKVTLWKNPVTEMQRTKALGLLHKTIKKDSIMSRVGIPDYVLFFRNEGDNEIPVKHQDKDSSKMDYLPVDLWQKYASPVWYDIDYSRTLQYRSGRDGNDEKHICPLQLDTIERILHLYSNEGEVVLSPFGGIGSEGCTALKMNRRSISIELKESYFKINEINHKAFVDEKKSTLTLF